MLYVAITSLVIIALLVVLMQRRTDRHEEASERQYEAWQAERAELLNRIQHPEYLPVPAREPAREAVAPPVDEFERVGTITFGEPLEDENRG